MQPAQLASFARVVAGIRERIPGLSFEILEIGAVPLGGAPEPFHRLLDDFPGSRIHAFELDPESCAQLQASARRGVETAHVVSAIALSDTQRAALSARLTEAGFSNLRLSERVDPSILGGLIVRIGSRLYDSSIKSKLQRLQFAMKGAA